MGSNTYNRKSTPNLVIGYNNNGVKSKSWGCARDIYKPSCEDKKSQVRRKKPQLLKKASAILELGGQTNIF